MTLESLRKAVRDALPKDHPVQDAFDDYVKNAGELEEANVDARISENSELLKGIFSSLDDWGRGILDWDDVEERLKSVRNRLQLD